MTLLRVLLFNAIFYAGHVLYLIIGLPVLLTTSERTVAFLRAGFAGAYWLERKLLGLDYVMEGAENMPASGTYIAAIKHQSLWETYKVQLWFNNPGVIMKDELRYVPLWGWYAQKVRAIFVKRGSGREAFRSLRAGAQRAKTEGRVIVIFPQGTRVAYGATAPYKRGVMELYSELNVPIVPMALNSGKYWPRRSLPRPGTVRVQVLPSIPPGLDPAEALRRLEHDLETASNAL